MPVATLEDLIDQLEEWLKDVDDILDNEPTDPLPEPEKAEVSQRLDSTEGNIDQILDPNEAPSLTPPDVGSVDTSITPTTGKTYARAIYQLAVDAKNESQSTSPDQSVIGSRIKTIKHLLTGFREAVGID